VIRKIFYVCFELHKLRRHSVNRSNNIKEAKSIFISKILFISQL